MKAGLISDALCSSLFSDLLSRKTVRSVAEFENRSDLFPGVHNSERFVVLALRNGSEIGDFAFDLLGTTELADPRRHIRMSPNDIRIMSPNTASCPRFRDDIEYDLARRAYNAAGPLIRHNPDRNPWGISIDRYINVSDFSSEIVTIADLKGARPRGFQDHPSIVPLMEGKLFHQFDHRFATYLPNGDTTYVVNKTPSTDIDFGRFLPRAIALRRNPELASVDAILCFRDIARRTDERAVIASVIPRTITDYTVRTIRQFVYDPERILLLIGQLNSLPFDYFCRQRLGGTHLTNDIVEQTVAVAPEAYKGWMRDVAVRNVSELSYVSWSLSGFFAHIGFMSPFVWNAERRRVLRAELDALHCHLFGLTRNDIEQVADGFQIVYHADLKAFGDYRTKISILDIYDHMQRAIDTGNPYETLLDPPPSDPRVAHPPREATNP